MLRLFTENPETSQAVFPIRWCVDKDDLVRLEKTEVKNPQLFISVERNGRETDRMIVPLSRMMDYIELHSTGKHTIHACIIWNRSNESPASKLKRVWLTRSSVDSFRRFVYESNWDVEERQAADKFSPYLLDRFETDYDPQSVTSLDVVVGNEFFAKEPPAWEKRWVNLWFEWPARNQCEFKKRRFLAYPIQPPVVALFIIWLVLVRTAFAIISGLLGRRYIKISPIWHPFRDETREVGPYPYWGKRFNFFLTGNDGEDRSVWFLFLHPISVAIWGALLYLMIRAEFLKSLAWIAVVLAIGFLVTKVASPVFGRLNNWFKKVAGKLDKEFSSWLERNATKREVRELVAVQAVRTETRRVLEALVCDAEVPLPVSVRALPIQKQTVYLKFKEVKARVCRPFSR